MVDSKSFAIATLAGLLLVAVGTGSVVTYHKAAPYSAALFSAATPIESDPISPERKDTREC